MFALVFFLHLLTCCYIAIGNLELKTDPETISWIERFGLSGSSNQDVYWTGWYFTTTTITTIGYGDIYGVTSYEKTYLIVLLFAGILVFTVIQQRTKTLIKEQTMANVLTKAYDDAIEFLFLIDDPIPSAIPDAYYD